MTVVKTGMKRGQMYKSVRLESMKELEKVHERELRPLPFKHV